MPRADRHDEPAVRLELLVERPRGLGSRRGDGDRGEGRVLGIAERPVADVHDDAPGVPGRLQVRACLLRELREPLDRVHLRRELGEDGRLVAGARPDVEHALAAARAASSAQM